MNWDRNYLNPKESSQRLKSNKEPSPSTISRVTTTTPFTHPQGCLQHYILRTNAQSSTTLFTSRQDDISPHESRLGNCHERVGDCVELLTLEIRKTLEPSPLPFLKNNERLSIWSVEWADAHAKWRTSSIHPQA